MRLQATNRELMQRIWALALPVVTYNLLEMTLGLADLVMVRSLGSDATAAVGLVRQLTFLVETVFVGISAGVITMVSQGIGKKDPAQVDGTVREALVLVTGFGLVVSLAGFLFCRPLFGMLLAAPDTAAYGVSYLRIYFLGVLFLGFNAVSAAIFVGGMEPRIPLKIAACMTLVNIPLNYVFIHGAGPVPGFEVQGAAMGTVLARATGSVVFLLLLLRGSTHVRLRLVSFAKMSFAQLRSILTVGMPIVFAGLLRNTARIAFLAVIGFSAYKASLHAAVGVGMQVRLIAVLPALAFQVATASLVGEAIGKRDLVEAEALAKNSLRLMGALMGVVTGLMIVFSAALASLFISDPEVAAMGSTVIRWFAVGQFFSALAISVQGSLSGAGDTSPIIRYMVISQWAFLVPAAYVSLRFESLDPVGPLAAWAVSSAIAFLLLYFRLRSGYWKSIRL